MQANKKILIDLVLILAVLLVVLIGYKLSPLLLPKADLTAQPAAGCDLQRQPCTADLPGGGRAILSMSPRPIPMVAPIEVEVAIEGASARRVEVDYAGVSMNMGYNRPQLAAVAPGRFRGQATLPVCVTGRMTWQATVLIETDRQRIAVPFRFDAPLE